MFGIDLAETQTIFGCFATFVLFFMVVQIGINASKAGKYDGKWRIDEIENKVNRVVNECTKYTDDCLKHPENEIWDIRKNITSLNERMVKVEAFPEELFKAASRSADEDDGRPRTIPCALRVDEI